MIKDIIEIEKTQDNRTEASQTTNDKLKIDFSKIVSEQWNKLGVAKNDSSAKNFEAQSIAE